MHVILNKIKNKYSDILKKVYTGYNNLIIIIYNNGLYFHAKRKHNKVIYHNVICNNKIMKSDI